ACGRERNDPASELARQAPLRRLPPPRASPAQSPLASRISAPEGARSTVTRRILRGDSEQVVCCCGGWGGTVAPASCPEDRGGEAPPTSSPRSEGFFRAGLRTRRERTRTWPSAAGTSTAWTRRTG